MHKEFRKLEELPKFLEAESSGGAMYSLRETLTVRVVGAHGLMITLTIESGHQFPTEVLTNLSVERIEVESLRLTTIPCWDREEDFTMATIYE